MGVMVEYVGTLLLTPGSCKSQAWEEMGDGLQESSKGALPAQEAKLLFLSVVPAVPVCQNILSDSNGYIYSKY